MGEHTELLLLTVNEHETRAVIDGFREHTGQNAVGETISKKVYRHLGVVNGARVAQTKSEMGSGGVGGAHATVLKAIDALKPDAVVAIGVAFGIDESKQAIGDILISKQLFIYDPQRVGQNIQFRGDKPHASTWLIDCFDGFAQTSWKGKANVHSGLLLTGEKLIDDLTLRKQLATAMPDAIGGEMEGAGLYAGAHNQIDWIVIKAICDWADGSKNTEKTVRQKLAAKNSVGFLLGALEDIALLGNATRNTKIKSLSDNPRMSIAAEHIPKIPRKFNDFERDTFLGQAFEAIATYIEQALKILQAENPTVDTSFKRIDSNRFVSIVYRDGLTVAQCKVSLVHRFGNSIDYSSNISLNENSMNESLRIVSAGSEVLLEHFGMADFGRKKVLTVNEAAEYYWWILSRNIAK